VGELQRIGYPGLAEGVTVRQPGLSRHVVGVGNVRGGTSSLFTRRADVAQNGMVNGAVISRPDGRHAR
jgi:hypothetical protein